MEFKVKISLRLLKGFLQCLTLSSVDIEKSNHFQSFVCDSFFPQNFLLSLMLLFFKSYCPSLFKNHFPTIVHFYVTYSIFESFLCLCLPGLLLHFNFYHFFICSSLCLELFFPTYFCFIDPITFLFSHKDT